MTSPGSINTWDNRGIHNFSLGCLCSYFLLNENNNSGKMNIIDDGVLFLQSPKPKTFVFFNGDRNIQKISELQKKGPVYSINRINLQGESEFHEVVYDLDLVFDDRSYKNTDKRKKALRAPFKKLSDWGVEAELITKENIQDIEALHSDWCEYKLSLPKTFQIMFSTTRYIRCCRLSAGAISTSTGFFKSIFQPKYIGILYRFNGSPSSAFVSSIEGDTAYSLAGFSRSWDLPSQFTHHTNIHFMKFLYEEKGVKKVNDGASLNKDLRIYKTHYPSGIAKSYRYSRMKEVKDV